MDGVHLLDLGEVDDLLDVEVGLQRIVILAHLVGLVRLIAVQGVAVFIGVDGDGADLELRSGPHDAYGDLATVGNEDAVKGCQLVRHRCINWSIENMKPYNPISVSRLNEQR